MFDVCGLKIIVKKVLGKVIKVFIYRPVVICIMDGGICSQITRYTIGKIIEERYGVSVKFDMNFFIKNAKDIDGKFERNYDLQKLCQDLKVNKAGYLESLIYRKFYSFIPQYMKSSDNNSNKNENIYAVYLDDPKWQLPAAPAYLCGNYIINHKTERSIYSKYCKFTNPEKVLDAHNMDAYSA